MRPLPSQKQRHTAQRCRNEFWEQASQPRTYITPQCGIGVTVKDLYEMSPAEPPILTRHRRP